MLKQIFKEKIKEIEGEVPIYKKIVKVRRVKSDELNSAERKYFLPNIDYVVEDNIGSKRIVSKSDFFKRLSVKTIEELKKNKSTKEAHFLESENVYAVQYTGDKVSVNGVTLESGQWLVSNNIFNMDDVRIMSNYEFLSNYKEDKKTLGGEVFDLKSVKLFENYKNQLKADKKSSFNMGAISDRIRNIKQKVDENRTKTINPKPRAAFV